MSLFAPLAQAETLLVASEGGISTHSDLNGDGVSDTETPIYIPKMGKEIQFVSLAENEYGVVYAGSKHMLWTFGGWTGEQKFSGLRTPEGISPQGWSVFLGGEGPTVRAQVANQDLMVLWSANNVLSGIDMSCRQFARHSSTGSTLCIGRKGKEEGIWIIPNTFAGLSDKPQFLPMNDERLIPIGLASSTRGVFLLSTPTSGLEGTQSIVLLDEVRLERSGFGPFSATFQFLGGLENSDPALTQPLAVGQKMIYLTTPKEGNSYVVWAIDPDGVKPATQFLETNGRPGAILVCSKHYSCLPPKG